MINIDFTIEKKFRFTEVIHQIEALLYSRGIRLECVIISAVMLWKYCDGGSLIRKTSKSRMRKWFVFQLRDKSSRLLMIFFFLHFVAFIIMIFE